MKKNKPSINEFNFAQIFNNSAGKTSGMLLVCTYACISAVNCFVLVCSIILGAGVYSILYKENLGDVLRPDIQKLLENILLHAGLLFGMGGTGLGIRRYTKDKPVEVEPTEEISEEEGK